MGAMKDFALFCQHHGLDHNTPSSSRLYLLGHVPRVPRIADGRPLTWPEVEEITGGRVGKLTVACPYCGADKSYSTCFQIQRLTLHRAEWHCFYCGVSGAAQSNTPFDPEREAQAQRAARAREREAATERTARALRIWEEADPIQGTLAETYMNARRLSVRPPNVDEVLRWHAALPWCRGERRPTLVALFRDVLSDRPVAIHRSFILSATDGIAERWSLGPRKGAAIKLWPLKGAKLAIAEGIENALAAIQLGVAMPPMWAATVANNIPTLAVIPSVRELTIYTDNDRTGTGEQAGRALARRWLGAGHKVHLFMPPKASVDFNNLIGFRRKS
jgi:hypothetical protein